MSVNRLSGLQPFVLVPAGTLWCSGTGWWTTWIHEAAWLPKACCHPACGLHCCLLDPVNPAAPAALQPPSTCALCCAAAMPPLWRQNISRAKRKFRNAMRAVSIFKTAVHSSPDRIERLDSFGEGAEFYLLPSTTCRLRVPSSSLCLAGWLGCYVEQQTPRYVLLLRH